MRVTTALSSETKRASPSTASSVLISTQSLVALLYSAGITPDKRCELNVAIYKAMLVAQRTYSEWLSSPDGQKNGNHGIEDIQEINSVTQTILSAASPAQKLHALLPNGAFKRQG